MKKGLFFVALAAALALYATAGAYDNFTEDLLDQANWSNYEKAKILLPSGKLFSMARSTEQGKLTLELFHFSNPQNIYSIKAEVAIQQIAVTQNASNNAEAEARLSGHFYNTKSSPTGYGGNVFAHVSIGERGNGLEAYWEIAEALNDDRSSWDQLGSGTMVDPGTLMTGTVYILELEYDESQNQFRFTISDQASAVLGSAQFDFSNRMGPAYSPWVSLGTVAYNDVTMASATFDNIYTKSSPDGSYTLYDDCSSYSTSKWDTLQFGRYLSDGKQVSVTQSDGSRVTNRLVFNGAPDYIEAKVAVSSETDIPAGGRGIARIDGYYFNDTTPPSQQTGYANNVWAHIMLTANGNQLNGSCNVSKSLNDDESQWDDGWSQNFDLFNFQFDQTYTLSIEFTGAAFNFKISDGMLTQIHTYTLPAGTQVYDAYEEFRSVRTRVYENNLGGGYIKATFDNVRTAPLPVGWETISGTVTYNDTPLCAMVLANGQHMFTCEDVGKYELDVPLDANGEITLFAFVSSLAPFEEIIDISSLDNDITMQSASPDSRAATVTTAIDTGTVAEGYARISGTITLDGNPLCAMALANGQYMFSCGVNNGVYDLTVPLDGNGQITLFVFVSGLQPYEQTF